MTETLIIAALACVWLTIVWWAEPRVSAWLDKDWRNGWCCLECWADEGQCGPCRDCPALRRRR